MSEQYLFEYLCSVLLGIYPGVELLEHMLILFLAFFLQLLYLFIYLFLAVLGRHCCSWAFSSCGKWGLLFFVVRRLLTAVASLVVEQRLQACGLQQLWHVGSVVVACNLQSTGSVVVAHGLSCSTACWIFSDQGLNPCPSHWQADSQPLCHQESPSHCGFYFHFPND